MCTILYIPWSVFWKPSIRLRWNDSKFAWFYCFYALEICCSVNGLDKGWMVKRFEALAVCDLMTWTHCAGRDIFLKVECHFPAFYTSSSRRYPSDGVRWAHKIEKWRSRLTHVDRRGDGPRQEVLDGLANLDPLTRFRRSVHAVLILEWKWMTNTPMTKSGMTRSWVT